MGSEWHAPYGPLKPETQDMPRALNSLDESLEAMDWYNQRIDVTHDEEVRVSTLTVGSLRADRK